MNKYLRRIRGILFKKYFDYVHNKHIKEMSKFPEFKGFHKITRYSRECIITEKIDGTNGLIYIDENNNLYVGSKNRWLWGSTQNEIHTDNNGFAKWCKVNKEELLKLGKGYHYGEFWGKGIQRTYGLKNNKFSLFNVSKWSDDNIRPKCCDVVPILFRGEFDTAHIVQTLWILKEHGSYAVSGYMNPEGIVIYHIVGRIYFKKTIENDEKPKGQEKDE